MRGTSLCEVLHRGSPETGCLVLLLHSHHISGMLSCMLITYLACCLACSSHIWHAHHISGMLVTYLACSSHIWHACHISGMFFVNLVGGFYPFKFSSFLCGPQERAEHSLITAPVPPRWGTATTCTSVILFSSSLLAEMLSTFFFIFDEFKSGSFIIILGCRGFYFIFRGFGGFNAFYLWGRVRESGTLVGASTSPLGSGASTPSTCGRRPGSQNLVGASTPPMGRWAYQLFLSSLYDKKLGRRGWNISLLS